MPKHQPEYHEKNHEHLSELYQPTLHFIWKQELNVNMSPK
jgi:hypothetical protein